MKFKYLLGLFAIVFIVGIFTYSCKKEKITPTPTNIKTVPFEASMSSNVAEKGESIDYMLKVKEGSLGEDVNVRFSFSGSAVNMDGTDVPQIEANDIFDNFTKSVKITKDTQLKNISFKIKDNFKYKKVSIKITGSIRGYNIDNATQNIDIYSGSYTTLSVIGQPNLSKIEITAGSKATFKAELAKEAKSNITITLSSDNTTNFIGLPTNITIKQGQKEAISNEISVLLSDDFSGGESQKATIKITVTPENTMLNSSEINIKVLNPNKELGSQINDERYVYTDPDIVYTSKGNKTAVEAWAKNASKNVLEIQEGTPHSNSELAAKGWKFKNAMEFSPIDALTAGKKVNSYGNRTPWFCSAQNVAGTQGTQAVDNNKYSNMNDAGNLVMWTAYDPGIWANLWNNAKWESRDYGVSAFWMNKFQNKNAAKWQMNNVRILPGMRIEVRARFLGQLYGMNPAIWLQGNTGVIAPGSNPWPYYGEADILEAPQFIDGSPAGAWQTFHWAGVKDDNTTNKDVTSGNLTSVDIHKWNIYWLEWRSNDEIAMGVNGKQTVVIRRSNYPNGNWPFSDTYTVEGFHLLLTFYLKSGWTANGNTDLLNSTWDKYVKNIPYATSKTNTDTPRMELDFIRYYTTDNYQYKGSFPEAKNSPMY